MTAASREAAPSIHPMAADGIAPELSGRISREQKRALLAISLSQLLLLSLWLSAAAVAPRLEEVWALTSVEVAGLTMAVNAGFFVGALALVISGLPDVLSGRTVFVIAAMAGLVANAALVLLGPGQYWLALSLRFLTGVALAGGYPSGLKAVAGWFRDNLGMAMGFLVGALTVGGGVPYLVVGLGLGWQETLLAASVLAAVAALIMGVVVTDGPYDPPPVRFSWQHLRQVVGNRSVRLASIAYFGHNWELFGLWTWVGVFLAASAEAGGYQGRWSSIMAFASIAIGGLGAWIAGRWADRFGRIPIASLALAVSGGAALLSPFVFGAPPVVVSLLFLVWGFAVVADSPLFSVMVTEAADETTRGTALTLQVSVGFLVPLITIGMVPTLAGLWGWQYAFLILAAGPAFSIAVLARLKNATEAHGHS